MKFIKWLESEGMWQDILAGLCLIMLIGALLGFLFLLPDFSHEVYK